MGFHTFPHVAGGDIRTCRFVKLSTSANNTVLEADANEAVIGISTDATRDAPQEGSSALAAADGEVLSITPFNGDPCLLEIGSGGCAAGDELKSDADGKGVVRASTGTTIQNVGAIALGAYAAGEIGQVIPFRSSVRPALS